MDRTGPGVDVDRESIVHRVTLDTAELAVTERAIHAYVPAGDGVPLREIDRFAVETVEHAAVGEPAHLRRGASVGVVGASLLALTAVVDFAGLIPETDVEGNQGMGGGALGSVADTLASIREVLAWLDLALLIGGLGLLAIGGGLIALYAASRQSVVRLAVTDAADVRIPVPDDADGEALAADLEGAIRPDPGTVFEGGDERDD